MDNERKLRVAIVGAGVTGLGAARWLVDNLYSSGISSVEVVVLEARDRIGGRVHTYCASDSMAKGLYDLGASWIHDPSINPLTVMAKSMRLVTLESDYGDEVVTNTKGKRVDDKSFEKSFSDYEMALFPAVAAARQSSLHSLSIQDLLADKLDQSNPLYQLFLSGLEFELGSPLRHCSATQCIDADWLQAINGVGDSNSAHLPSYNEPDDLLLPDCGFSVLMDGLLSGEAVKKTTMEPKTGKQSGSLAATSPSNFDVLLNHELLSVKQGFNDVDDCIGAVRLTMRRDNPAGRRVFVHDSAISAPYTTAPRDEAAIEDTATVASDTVGMVFDAVLITVPLGVLKHGSIVFSPPLSSAKQHAIDTVGFGNVVKVIIEFSQVFWPTHSLFLAIADSALANPRDRGLLTYFLNGHKFAGKKVLVGYGLGDGAAALDEMSDEALTELIMSRCAALALPDRKLPAAPIRVVRSRWAEDPYARGAYSYWAPGNLPGVRTELGRREGQLWFAGEAVHESSLHSSSVHGAWSSGVAAAAEICAHLQIPVVLQTTIAPSRGRKKKV